MSALCHRVTMKNSTKDDVYAYALSKTLTKVSSPATVGLYSACLSRSSMILEQTEAYMNREASRIEQKSIKDGPKPRSSQSFTGFMALIGRLIFYWPVWTEENQQRRNIRFIYVHFSAWHFAGSDLLWAGIAIRLFQAMQFHFGKIQFVLYRVLQYREEDEFMKTKEEEGHKDWRSKKICCCPLWCLVLCILMIPVIMGICLLTVGLLKAKVKPSQNATTTNNHLGVLGHLFIASLGVPAVAALKYGFSMSKNFIFSLESNLRRAMDNERISSKLGFMNEVRKEMWLVSRFIKFMEVFERRRIRVVLQITNLDRCSPRKIVAVLEAINILLSDEESPYISILAVNPHVLIEKVNFADGCFSKEDRAYALLNRIVTLPFTVPPLCDDSKHHLFSNLTSHSKFIEQPPMNRTHRKNTSSSDVQLVEIVPDTDESNTLIDTAELDVKEEVIESLVWSILNSSDGNLNQYMLDDAMSMRRVINSVQITAIIMKALKKDIPQPKHIVAWVVLANHWPCRLSWIIQCVEDAEQRAEIDGKNIVSTMHSKTLWKVFSESKAELYVMSAEIQDLLEQDGDPEMFERFLTVDFKFTVNDLKTFEVTTVNLDHSIRKELAQIRGTSKLKESGWMKNLAPLPLPALINMSTDDVCKELERMKFPHQYIDTVKSNDLNGLALVFGDVNDLKALLGMNFGEWATFRLHFLSSPSNLRTQYRSTMPTLSPNNQLWKFFQNTSSHYSSNVNLAKS
ncbi:NTPase KAP family P-loop domain-containing protein 1 isoform X2 [Gouania willdenowi]|uniref:KAP NTPase domain-containing protein n=1 Tax=Gouania willdenowi TaxID=441366 RepID=A0A8C5GW59_GOUWI|nr:NTPase KAP family P-loop domain-containing protein 1 isoform X2 [Gouania willdenowi]